MNIKFDEDWLNWSVKLEDDASCDIQAGLYYQQQMPKTNKKRIESEWNNFSNAVMPTDAPAIQRKEMRRAFYAGVWAMLSCAKQLANDDISEDAGVMVLEAIEAQAQRIY